MMFFRCSRFRHVWKNCKGKERCSDCVGEHNRPVATGAFGGNAPQISFVTPQILLFSEIFLLEHII